MSRRLWLLSAQKALSSIVAEGARKRPFSSSIYCSRSSLSRLHQWHCFGRNAPRSRCIHISRGARHLRRSQTTSGATVKAWVDAALDMHRAILKIIKRDVPPRPEIVRRAA